MFKYGIIFLISLTAINGAPRIIKQLKDTTVEEGATLHLELEIEACPAPRIKWLRNGREVTADARIKISRDSIRNKTYNLDVSLIKYEEQGEYEVYVTNELGTVSSKSHVTVHSVIQTGEQEVLAKGLNDNDTWAKGYEFAMQNSVQSSSGKQRECTNSRIVEKSGIPLVKLGGRYYYFGTYFKTNFFNAMQFCRDHRMDLLSIETNEENTRIFNYISRNYGNSVAFWTSGSDLGEQSQFVWLSTGKSLNFTYWGPPNPDNAGNNEHCIHIYKHTVKNYIWNDIPCTDVYYFICEVQECSDFCIN